MTRNWQDIFQDGQGLSKRAISQLAGIEVDLATALAYATGGPLTSVAGRNYKVVSGVIRNDGATAYWYTLEPPTGHRSQNVDSVTTDGTYIYINYDSIGATNVVSFIATPDETLSMAGFSLGPSVTKTQAKISIKRERPIQGFVFYDGSAWQVSSQDNNPTGNIVFTSFTSGTLIVSHDDIGTSSQNGVSVTGRGGVLVPQINSASGPNNTNVKIQFFDWAGTLQTSASTDMKAYIQRHQNNGINPQLLTTTQFPLSNIWFLGVFEV